MRLAVDISIEGDITPEVLEQVAQQAAEQIMGHVFEPRPWRTRWKVDRVGRLPAPRWIGDEQ